MRGLVQNGGRSLRAVPYLKQECCGDYRETHNLCVVLHALKRLIEAATCDKEIQEMSQRLNDARQQVE